MLKPCDPAGLRDARVGFPLGGPQLLRQQCSLGVPRTGEASSCPGVLWGKPRCPGRPPTAESRVVTPPLRAESSSVKGVTPPTGVKAGSPHLRQVLRERGGAAPSQRAGTPRTQPEGTGLGSLLCRGGWPQFPHLCHGPASKPSRSPSSGYLGPLLPLSFLQPQWVPGQGGTLGPRPACDVSVPARPPHIHKAEQAQERTRNSPTGSCSFLARSSAPWGIPGPRAAPELARRRQPGLEFGQAQRE